MSGGEIAMSGSTSYAEEKALFLNCPVISTERLVLRPPHADDAEELAYLADNLKIARMLAHMPHPYTIRDAERFIANSQEGIGRACIYSITEAATGKFLGVGSLHMVEGEASPRMGYWIGEPFWGKGYATEAARALIDLYFKVTNRPVLRVSARIDNDASKSIIQKCGGRHVSRQKAMHPLLGEIQELDDYEITRESWMGQIAA